MARESAGYDAPWAPQKCQIPTHRYVLSVCLPFAAMAPGRRNPPRGDGVSGAHIAEFSHGRAKSLETQPIARFGRVSHSWCESQIEGRCVQNVRKSAKTRHGRGEWPQNQAVRTDGRSVRIFAKSREIPPAAGLGRMGHSGCGREITGRRARKVESRRK